MRPSRKHRKAQIQMGETIVVVFIFIILITFGIIAYVNQQTSNIDEQKSEQNGLRATEVVLRALYLPEIRCSFDDVPVHNCIDLGKLVAFMNYDPINDSIKNPNGILPAGSASRAYDRFNAKSGEPTPEKYLPAYYDLFGYATINLSIVIPTVDENVVFTIYKNRPDWAETGATRRTFIPVSTYNPREKEGYRYGYGILEVTSYYGGQTA
ncbi:MAG: hypothetical protein GXP63_03215 [DPANN group archaeon]|nr:hypothetical protein [DPANN group archaeon]